MKSLPVNTESMLFIQVVLIFIALLFDIQYANPLVKINFALHVCISKSGIANKINIIIILIMGIPKFIAQLSRSMHESEL